MESLARLRLSRFCGPEGDDTALPFDYSCRRASMGSRREAMNAG